MTIDEDVAVELQRLRRTRNANLKDLVNNALRLRLRQNNDHPTQKKPFHTRKFDAGRVLVASIDNTAELLAEIEGEAFD